MKKKRYYIRMTAALLVLMLVLLATLSVQTQAEGTAAINMDNEKFQQLTGDAVYINYADNYYIDVEDVGLGGWGDGIGNKICNMFFFGIRYLGHITANLFYFCMDFDLSELFRDQIGEIQKALKNGIFEPLFILAFCGAAIHMLKKLVQRDLMGAYGQVLKVIGIFVLSVLVVRDSARVLSAATGITKSASAQILSGMQGEENTNPEDYAAEAAGALWVNLVHQPWVYVEFWKDAPGEGEIENLLSDEYAVGSSEREKLIKNHVGRAFLKEYTWNKAAFVVLLLIPTAIKCVIYIVMGVLSMAFQLMAVFYVLLAPIILILAMIPGYESLLSTWLKKLLETQLGILVMSFIMGLLLMVDNLMFTHLSVAWGWIIVLVVQVAIEIFVIMKRQELLGLVGKLQRTASNPGYARAMLQHGNANGARMGYDTAVKTGKLAAKAAGYVGGRAAKMAGFAGKQAVRMGHALGEIPEMTGTIVRTSTMTGVVAYAAENKIKRPRLSDFDKESQGENIIRVAPRGRGDNRHLERVDGGGKTVTGQMLDFSASEKVKDVSVSPQKPHDELKRPSLKGFAGESSQERFEALHASQEAMRHEQHQLTGQPDIQIPEALKRGAGNDPVSLSELPGEEVNRPTLKEWENDISEQRKEQSGASASSQEPLGHETTGQPVVSASGMAYQGSFGEAAAGLPKPHIETIRPSMKEFKGNEQKPQEGDFRRPVQDVQKPTQSAVGLEKKRNASQLQMQSARERQKENLAAQQEIPIGRPEYSSPSNMR